MVTGKRIATNGRLTVTDGDAYLMIPVLKRSFRTKGLENCQTVYGSDIIFIGQFTDEETIELETMDDLPDLGLCDKLGNFFSVIRSKENYLAAVRPDLCSISLLEDGSAVLTAHLNEETLEVALRSIPEEIGTDTDKLEDWFFGSDMERLALINAKEDTVSINKEEKKISLSNATIRFL